MRIHNVRLGHATNSSSTHSIVYTEHPVSDYDVEDGFNWNFFTAASVEAKNLYLAITLYNNLEKQVSRDIALAVVRDWVGVTLAPSYYGGIEGSVDHQSVITLPLEFSGKGIHKQFFDEFKSYLLKDGVIILGGNDNTEDSHPLSFSTKNLNLPLPIDTDPNLVARKDDSGYWTLFNRTTGTKIRFTFEDLDYVPVRASTPELVDLKITDYCTEGCAYCYQDSTPEGIHGKTQDINSILYDLAKAEVLEVALGGGETTDHPDFAEIVALAKYYKIVPNFTTKSLKWLKEPWAKQVLADIGGFAYSINNHKQIPKFVAEMKKLGYPEYPQRLYIHYVLGSTPTSEYKRILETAYTNNIQVTLLGFKTTGRGGVFTQFPHENWLDIIKEMRENGKYIRIGIDTAIVEQYGRTIQLEGISDCLYHSQEGKFSCYIDAVTNRIAPSSYSDRTEFKPFGQNWLEDFSKF